MKQILAIVAFVSISFGGFAQKQVIADENAEQRPASGFHAIKVSNAIDVFIVQGNEEGLAVSAKTKEFRDQIKTEVRNGVLVISYSENGWRGGGNRN